MRFREAVPPLCAAAITLLVAAIAVPPSAQAGGARVGPSDTSGPRGGDFGSGGNVGGGAGGGSGGGGGNSGGGGGNSGGGGGNSGGGGGSDDSGGGGSGSGHHGGGNGHHDGSHHGGGNRGGHHGGFHGYQYPRFWGSFFFGYPYPFWYYGPWGYDDGYSDGGYRDRDEQGALDLDLSPADTQVYVNGQYVGKVDDFDGWPQYLWLDTGTYDIVFYREGYKTLARQVTIYRGLVIDWNDRLERGPSIRPADLETKTHERRDARVEQDREMRERHEYREESGKDRDRDDDARSGRLHLAIEPHDASVYLDGRFLGTGDDVGRMSSGLQVDPGPHTLSVVRPGRHAEEQRFEVKPGAQIELRIELKSE
jgi:hypothetical protein